MIPTTKHYGSNAAQNFIVLTKHMVANQLNSVEYFSQKHEHTQSPHAAAHSVELIIAIKRKPRARKLNDGDIIDGWGREMSTEQMAE